MSPENPGSGFPWPLSATLESLELPLAPLLGGDVRERAMHVARLLPASLGNCVFFEVWLGVGPPRVDLIVRVREHGRQLLAAEALESLPAPLRTSAEWRQVAAFARHWSESGGRIERLVEGLWLEFDLEPRMATAGAALPRVFVDLLSEAQGGPSHRDRLESAATVLRAFGRDFDATAGLFACFEHLPGTVRVLYLGLQLGRSSGPIRLCLQGARRDLVAWLQAVNWPGDIADLSSQVLEPFDRARAEDSSAVSILHVDVGDSLAPKIGIEYGFARAGQSRGLVAEQVFLEYLVARGWCAPQRRMDLLGWPGQSLELLQHEVWHSRVTRRLSHVKVAYATAQPVELKAYVCFFHKLVSGGTLVGDRLACFGQTHKSTPTGGPALPDRGGARSGRRLLSVGQPTTRKRLLERLRRVDGTEFASYEAGSLGGLTMLMSTAEKNALEKILERATVDRAFRQGLLDDPRRAIQEAFGVKIPRDFRVKFMEKGADVDALVVLPDFRSADGELGDGDLENVAGGGGTPPPTTWADGIDG